MQRRAFLTSASLAGAAGSQVSAAAPQPTRDLRKEPFRRFVIMGESTVQGGGWVIKPEYRFADVLAGLINACQEQPVEYFNKGIGANAISPRSPGYEKSAKPSAMERYKKDVIELRPDLFVLCYGLNDMRAGMRVRDFREDMATIIGDVKKACDPMLVLTTVYYMTGWRSFAPYDKGSVRLTLEYNKSIRSLAAEFGGVVADVWQAEGGADWLIHPDGVHANRVGNLLIAHRIFEAIAQHASGLTVSTFAENQQTKWTENTTRSRAKSGDAFRKTW